jgi:hypothetical protein
LSFSSAGFAAIFSPLLRHDSFHWLRRFRFLSPPLAAVFRFRQMLSDSYAAIRFHADISIDDIFARY